MGHDLDNAARERLQQYIDTLGTHLKDRRKREFFAIYAAGMLGSAERKSVEPIASLASGDATTSRHMHDKLLHFVGGSQWSDAAVRLEATRHVCRALAQHERVTTWVVDDTGFLKQGSHSVGVHRQYTGTAGKVTNCQVGVSLEIATASQHAPIDFELYLPEKWANDAERRVKARIPREVVFKTKIELAIGMIERAKRAEIPGEIILADSAYGSSAAFRHEMSTLGFDYAVRDRQPDQGVSRVRRLRAES